MTKLPLFIVLLFSAAQLFAQGPGGGAPRGNQSGSAHIFGKVTDEKGEAVSFATVIILQSRFDSVAMKSKDLLLKGVTTENNGEFSFENIPLAGKLKLQISYLGYETYEQLISLAGGMPYLKKDLGKIILKENSKTLKETVVTATQSNMTLDVDKKVFNVTQNMVSTGGTAVDVMKNVPSINVDIDGNVTLRNSAPQILLDGRPTTLTLDQIPADAIEKVEVITNPSAKYDASGGGAGILNIVLKKNRKTGYNGNVRAGASQIGEANLGTDFNLRQNKINFTGSLNGRLHSSRTTGSVDRTNLNNGVAESLVEQSSKETMHGQMVFGKVGIDYLATNRTTFSLSGVKMIGSFGPEAVLKITNTDLTGSTPFTSFSRRNTSSERNMNNGGLVVGMKHLFPTDGHELTFDANYFQGKYNAQSLYGTDYFINGENSIIYDSLRQQILGEGSDKNLVMQTDYVKPFKSKLKLETGLRAAMRSRTTSNNNYTFINTQNAYGLIYNPASNYKNQDNVFAAYASVSKMVKTFGYKVGLRVESSNYKGELTDTKQTFSNTYPVSLFPSVFLTKKLTETQDLQLSVTRRINRPNFMQLIPFTDSTDKYNITQGNAGLRPEFTQSAEVSYMKKFKKNNSLLASVYYKYTNNLITRYLQKVNEGTLINTYINANSAYSAGAELTSQNNISKWWSTTTNLNFYNSGVNASNIAGAKLNNLWSWFGKFNSSFKLKRNYTIQLSAIYQSKTNIPVSGGGGGGGPWNQQAQSASQGYIKAFYAVDLAVKKVFMKDKASLTLSVNDIFKTRYTNIYSESIYFTQEYSRISNPQIARLNFSYNFGKLDAVLFKRKTKGTGEDVSQ